MLELLILRGSNASLIPAPAPKYRLSKTEPCENFQYIARQLLYIYSLWLGLILCSLLTEIKTAGHGQWNHQFLRRTVPVHCTPYSYSYTAHKSVTFSRFKRALNCNQHQLFMIVSCGQAAFSLHGYLTSLLVGSMQKMCSSWSREVCSSWSHETHLFSDRQRFGTESGFCCARFYGKITRLRTMQTLFRYHEGNKWSHYVRLLSQELRLKINSRCAPKIVKSNLKV